MITKFATTITNYIESKGDIPSGDRKIYLYGIWQGLVILANFITMALVGALFGVLLYMLIFTIAFVPLRSYAGGYHASTPLRCYSASVVMMVFLSIMFSMVTFSDFIMVTSLIILGLSIILLSPVAHHNKPLDEVEVKVYGKRAIRLCGIWLFIALLSLQLGIPFLTTGIFWAFVTVLLLQVLQKLLGQKPQVDELKSM